jgi:hypothetical protein
MEATYGFLLLAGLSLALFYSSGQLQPRALVAVLAWVLVVSAFALSGLFSDDPRRFIGVMAGLFAGTGLLIWYAPQRPVAQGWFLALHSLRMGVEWVLHELYGQGLVPRLMTWDGWNFDIAIGITAALLGLVHLVRKKPLPALAWKIWNLTGLAFLLWIVAIAIFSAPLPLQQLAFDQPNVAVLSFPFCLLPALVVPLVFLAHWRALRS